ncbi:hypothetical protein, partial [Franconibacter helveticus]|uniref:hypothetical protein n=1 Tax=Franconibacter helveticus TaxID=357240 RepID=UPI0019550AB3
ILRFPLSESTLNFRIFSLPTHRRCVMFFISAVSMEAHYRACFMADKQKLEKIYRPLLFQTLRRKDRHHRLVLKQKRAPQGSFLLFCDLLHSCNFVVFYQQLDFFARN